MVIRFVFLLLFLIVSVLNIMFSKQNNERGIFFTKPLLMPLLIIFYLLGSSNPNYLIAAALTAGFLGDLFLLRPKKEAFLLGGIGSFLIGHIFYIMAFINNSALKRDEDVWFYCCLLLYIWAGALIFKKLFPRIKSMKLPAMIYMLVVFMMSFMSLSRITIVPLLSFLLVYLGSVLFIVSDIILAYDMFSQCRENDAHYVMSTYILAQFLITIGFLMA